MIFQGIRTSIAKKPYIFLIFQGGGSWPPATPLWVRAWVTLTMLKEVGVGET